MTQFNFESLIPTKYYPIVHDLEKEVIIKNTFEKFFLKQSLLTALKKLYKNFLEIDNALIAADFETLEKNETLQLTDYDKECVNYNLQPLNFAEIYRLLDNLYYEKIYHNFLIVESTYLMAQDLLKEMEYFELFRKVETLRKLNDKFREICYGKNLADLYENRVTWVRRSLKYLNRYINALM